MFWAIVDPTYLHFQLTTMKYCGVASLADIDDEIFKLR